MKLFLGQPKLIVLDLPMLIINLTFINRVSDRTA